MIKLQNRLAVHDLQLAKRRTGADHVLLPVRLVPGEQRQTMPHIGFVAGMNVIQIVHQIRGQRFAGILDVPRGPGLQLPKFRQNLGTRNPDDFAAVILERRNLHEIERKISFVPQLAPAAHQRRHLVGIRMIITIIVRAHAIRLALIPQRPTNAKTRQRRDHCIVQHRRRGGRNLVRRNYRRAQRLECRYQIKPRRRCPRLNPRAAPGRFNQPHRHIQIRMNLPAEEIGGCGKMHPVQRRRTARLPGFELRQILQRLGRQHLFRDKQPDARIICRRNFLLRIQGWLLARLFAHRLLHVRLAGRQPHLAHQHICQRLRLAGFHHQRLRRERRLKLAQLHQPLAIRRGRRLDRLPRKAHRHRRARRAPAPDRHPLLLLQHHVITKNGGQFQLGTRRKRHRANQPGQRQQRNQSGKFHGVILPEQPPRTSQSGTADWPTSNNRERPAR